MSGKVTIEKKVYKVLIKDIADLMDRLDKAKEALRFYADSDCYEKFGSDGLSEIDEDGGELAQKVLEEIER